MKAYFSKLYFVITAVLLFTCYACKSAKSESSIKNITFIDSVKSDIIKENYRYFLQSIMHKTDAETEKELSKIKYSIVLSKVTYEAIDPFGEVKELSGLVAYPVLPASEKGKALNVVSIQHGTLSSESGAPSLYTFKGEDATRDIFSVLISSLANGYITLMPDYFGYGADQKNQHYYEVSSSLAAATRNLIDAIPSLGLQTGLNISHDNLYLCGYSEGGFATMSTLKSFSEIPTTFNNIITIAGAGAYDKLLTAQHVVQQTTGDSPIFTASYLWVLLTYNKVYGLNRNLNELLQPNIESKVEKYVGTDKIMQLEDIPSAPAKAFNPQFIKGTVDGTDEGFIKALKDNNVSNFEAKGTLELVHGSSDTWVPTLNTDSAYVRLKNRGVNVTKTIYPNGTHSSTYPVFITRVLDKL